MMSELKESGYCVIPEVLSASFLTQIKAALEFAVAESERRGTATFIPQLDPNDRNVRVFNLIDLHPIFRELIMHPTALELVRGLLGEQFLISNFTANIAKPGSQSMKLHSDQAIVVPEPWLEPWSINVIWCLDDVYAENGATRYLPNSHQIERLSEVPDRPAMKPFSASAGSVIAMDGRLWHISGANTTDNADRALLFGYYSRDFVRPQVNWNAALSPKTLEEIKHPLFDYLGLGPTANIRHGASLTQLDST